MPPEGEREHDKPFFELGVLTPAKRFSAIALNGFR